MRAAVAALLTFFKNYTHTHTQEDAHLCNLLKPEERNHTYKHSCDLSITA